MVPDMLIVISLMLGSTLGWTPPGSVLNIPQEVDLVNRIQADNDNCNVYYYLKVPMTCGEGNAFNKATLRCDSVENVGKVDPGCGGGYGGSSRVSGRNGGNRQRGRNGGSSKSGNGRNAGSGNSNNGRKVGNPNLSRNRNGGRNEGKSKYSGFSNSGSSKFGGNRNNGENRARSQLNGNGNSVYQNAQASLEKL